MITTTHTPPNITRTFSHNLLSKFMRTELDRVEDSYAYIERHIERYKRQNPNKKVILELLEAEYKKVYERAKAKEEDVEATKNSKGKRPFYSPELDDPKDEAIYQRFRDRRDRSLSDLWKNYEV